MNEVDSVMYTALNVAALLGWTFVLLTISIMSTYPISPTSDPLLRPLPESNPTKIPFVDLICILEVICCFEVYRIATGQLKGNLVLGAVLHMIRMTCLLFVIPKNLPGSDGGYITMMVLYSWSITEVGRYPMYIFPNLSIARSIRLVVPIFTFPVGCGAEAYGAYCALRDLLLSGNEDSAKIVHWIKIGLLIMVTFVNGVLGPTMAYPALLKKGLPVLLGKKTESKKKRS